MRFARQSVAVLTVARKATRVRWLGVACAVAMLIRATKLAIRSRGNKLAISPTAGVIYYTLQQNARPDLMTCMDVRRIVGKNVRKFRLAAKLTQAEWLNE